MIKIDMDKFLDTATVEDYEEMYEDPTTSMTRLRTFFSDFIVDGNGNAVPQEQASEILKKLPVRKFKELRRTGELRDCAVPPESETGSSSG